ncbi:MAG: hypothetical protein U9R38_04270 [Candidatus Margulisiibacteriota bacterium]|nr:hypothetical protein [Candidatus Margulisiibacteriota bacterium]
MRFLSILICCLLLVPPTYAQETPKAAWSTYGLIVNDTPGNSPQQNPKIISNGSNGYFLAWEDGRSGYYNVYLQKIDRAGVPLWAKHGIAAGKSAGNQNFPQLITDGLNGVVVVWQDYRNGNSDIFAQKISSNGSPLWGRDGIPICQAAAGQFAPEITSDGHGGAIITWHDYRGRKGEDIFAQRIDSKGNPLWQKDGVAVSISSGTQWYPKITGDGSGGAIIVWTDGRTSASDNNIYAQRIDALGNLLWEKEGKAVSLSPGNQERPVIMSAENGAILAWNDARSGNFDIYLQKIDLKGKLLWNKDGIAACKLPFAQENPRLSKDGAGGAIVIWTDHRAEKSDIYAQRIYHDGKTAWQENGRPVTIANGTQKNPEIVKLNSQDWVVIWEDSRKGRSDLFAQKINSSGIPIWHTNGIPLASTTQSQESPSLVASPSGNVIIAWEDKRSGNYDIHAQKLTPAGELLWGKNGNIIGSAIGSVIQQNLSLIFTEYGEIILVFEDARSGFFNIYAQKITPAGKLAWGQHGTAIAKVAANQLSPRIVSDGKGGAIISWEDYRIKQFPMIRAQRINRSGKKVWASSLPLSKVPVHQTNPLMVSDDAGGTIIAWQDNRNVLSLQDVYAQRVSPKGKLLWGSQGKAIISANGNQIDADMISDGSGGAILAWTDYRRGDRNPDIYAQRVNSKGAPLWQEDGAIVCGAPDVQRRPKIISDGNGGAMIAWTDRGGGSYDIYAQRVNKGGQPVWMKDGIPINQSGRTQQNAKFGNSNVLVWEDYRYGNWDIFAGAIDLSGKLSWNPKGIPVALIPHTQYSPQVVKLNDENVLIIWEDYRSGKNYELYVQKLDSVGQSIWDENGIKINTVNGGRNPKIIASESGGSFYVFWEDYASGGRAIYGQRYLLN